jgi:tetratricopeptide (TPR) repeat protein
MKVKMALLGCTVLLLSLSLSPGITPARAQSGPGDTKSEGALRYFQRGDYYFARKDFAQAIGEYNQAIAKDDNYGMAYGNRAAARVNCGDYKGALEDVEIARGICGNFPCLGSLKDTITREMQTTPQQRQLAQQHNAANKTAANAGLPFTEMPSKPFTVIRSSQHGKLRAVHSTIDYENWKRHQPHLVPIDQAPDVPVKILVPSSSSRSALH